MDEEILNQKSEIIRELLTLLEETNANLSEEGEEAIPSLNDECFLNNSQVCEKLHISQRSLQDYRDKGFISFYKVEGKILYKESDILRLLDDNYYPAWTE